ncbi:uncharacterized protein K489DRAFT_383573 [Dissoconium aciculare CBS 342.82]|uniref:Uncharacterized protein n=1 Tax=Dissoconium aciculare CBS 342.82 TaxID=1314786 RepID=A0A6J3LW76_9PEZI|nr:uncharacterized protein K489DRAFT_383573 [Dissoconium aciculare CBS 342.82]KAF1820025.1 hypothetical protein K489DRAFT_383573 [Dissoconium aciculare CBS 342.82]
MASSNQADTIASDSHDKLHDENARLWADIDNLRRQNHSIRMMYHQSVDSKREMLQCLQNIEFYFGTLRELLTAPDSLYAAPSVRRIENATTLPPGLGQQCAPVRAAKRKAETQVGVVYAGQHVPRPADQVFPGRSGQVLSGRSGQQLPPVLTAGRVQPQPQPAVLNMRVPFPGWELEPVTPPPRNPNRPTSPLCDI